MKPLKLVFFALTFAFMFCGLNARSNDIIENYTIAIETNDNIVGYWEYYVPEVDPMYQKGVMHIAKEGAEYSVKIELPNGSIPTEDVEVNGNEVKFALYVEGGRVEVTVSIEGDTLTGSGSSDDGPFTLTGKRKAKPE